MDQYGQEYTLMYSCVIKKHRAKSVYSFEFSRWKNNQLGIPLGIFEMNVLMTAVEKIFGAISNAYKRSKNAQEDGNTGNLSDYYLK